MEEWGQVVGVWYYKWRVEEWGQVVGVWYYKWRGGGVGAGSGSVVL